MPMPEPDSESLYAATGGHDTNHFTKRRACGEVRFIGGPRPERYGDGKDDAPLEVRRGTDYTCPEAGGAAHAGEGPAPPVRHRRDGRIQLENPGRTAWKSGVQPDFVRPGKPTENGIQGRLTVTLGANAAAAATGTGRGAARLAPIQSITYDSQNASERQGPDALAVLARPLPYPQHSPGAQQTDCRKPAPDGGNAPHPEGLSRGASAGTTDLLTACPDRHRFRDTPPAFRAALATPRRRSSDGY